MKEANRAGEILYLTAIELEHKEGIDYLFVGLDEYSKVILPIDEFPSTDSSSIKEAIILMLEKSEFKMLGNWPFKLVLPFDNSLSEDISQLLPDYGELIFDAHAVMTKAHPYIDMAMQRRR